MTADPPRREALTGDPLAVLARWVDEARAAGLTAPEAMVLATTGPDGVPHARTVLITALDPAGPRFHTSRPTTKTRDLDLTPRAAGVFLWPALGRQVIVQGVAEELPATVSRAAFPDRPPPLRRLAWAYERLTITLRPPDHAVDAIAVDQAFAEASPDAGAPQSWTTYRLVLDRVDCWQAGDADRPPVKTRFTRRDGRWRAVPVLP